jgi:protocatechuate 3,4-dioxygenase beta subunit
MDLDDRPAGRLLSRRDALSLLGAGSLGVLSSATMLVAQNSTAVAQCVVRPEMTEGPYFLDKQDMRADIRAEASTGALKPGVPLSLAFAVSQVAAGTCLPLSNAVVDVWQCDAVGEYSGVVDPRFASETVKQAFLRGAQQTDSRGAARFMTIYPGWYSGRAVHIHFKIRTQTVAAQAYEFTSQLFLPEDLTDQIHGQSPYSAKGRRDTLNERDGIYRGGGDQLLLQPTKMADGYQASMAIALDLTDSNVGRADAEGGRGRGRRGRGGR